MSNPYAGMKMRDILLDEPGEDTEFRRFQALIAESREGITFEEREQDGEKILVALKVAADGRTYAQACPAKDADETEGRFLPNRERIALSVAKGCLMARLYLEGWLIPA